MAISDATLKLLWGRAAGTCSNPKCRDDLTVILENGDGYNVGEMAHVIARSPSGPRGISEGGDDSYENLILLCPTCHRHIDKAPEQHSEALLRAWKAEHEHEVRQKGSAEKFENLADLKAAVGYLLAENKSIWTELGPQSEVAKSDPGSNAYILWQLKKLKSIVPNNSQIINLIAANQRLLGKREMEVFVKFKLHADGFEQNQYERLDKYPLFPAEFAEVFGQ